MKKETPAKIIVIVLLILSIILTMLLIGYASRLELPKLDLSSLSGVLSEVEDTAVPAEIDEYSATEESDVASSQDHIESEDTTIPKDVDEYLHTEGSDDPNAPDRIEAEEGTLIPNEKYYLYDMSDCGDDLVMYSNCPNYYWVTDNDWAAFLYVDYAAEMNVANYDEEATNVTIDSVKVLDHDVIVYIYEAEDCITVVSAIYDDVVLEVQNYDATNIESALKNFVEAADIQLVTE